MKPDLTDREAPAPTVAAGLAHKGGQQAVLKIVNGHARAIAPPRIDDTCRRHNGATRDIRAREPIYRSPLNNRPSMLPELSSLPPAYLLIPVVLIAATLLRRVPIVGGLVTLASWALVLAMVAIAFGQQQRFEPYLGRLAAMLKLDGQEVVGEEVRIRMAPDGHFWARVTIDGVPRRMLIDSGATITALSPPTASAAGLDVRNPVFPVLLQTANGTISARTAKIDSLRLGNILARDVAVVVSPGFGNTDVIGMNLLSRLQSWRVEGRTLILVPHHPQPSGKAPATG